MADGTEVGAEPRARSRRTGPDGGEQMNGIKDDLQERWARFGGVVAAEVYSPPRVTEEARLMGMPMGMTMGLTTWLGLATVEDRRRARQQLAAEGPMVGGGAAHVRPVEPPPGCIEKQAGRWRSRA